MEVRNETKDVILGAARRVLQNTTGDLADADAKRLRVNLEARIPLYSGRYPIPGLLKQLEDLADAGPAAAIGIDSAMKRQRD